uniref:uncharacterized protein PF11_0207-like isoform X2 n=1 Tax=Erigeron canadensis TaxID=72917 RepID=UPI001CB91853|nr:uncharacterized protein PF11_0207-like isoform X2 [Erigeron canadensis]
MSGYNNQCCSYLLNQQSFSLFTQFNTPLKPSLTTTFRPVFTFHNCFRKRPRCRTLYNSPPRSSSDVVLIATTEHRDGSLVFHFGDASEVVKNDDVVEEVESLSEQDGKFLKVLDGDNEIQTVEADDGIRNADIDSDVDGKETNIINDLKEEEALSLPLDEIDCTSQLEGAESSNSTLSLLNDGQNKDTNEESEETLLKNSDSENEDLSVSVKLETEGDSDKVRIENSNTSDPEDLVAATMPAPMHNPDVELTVAENEDVEKELKDKFINDSTLINEMLPSYTLDVELTVAEDEDVEEESKDNFINDSTLKNEMLPSDTLNIELTVAASEDVVEELKDMNINEGTFRDEIRPSDTLDVELTAATSKDAEEEFKILNINGGILMDEMLPPDTSDVELTVSASEDIEEELKDTKINEGILIDEMPPSDTLSDMSDVELMVSASEDVEEGLKDPNINESTLIDETPPSTTLDVDLMVAASVEVEEELENKNISESTLMDEMPPSDTLDVQSTVAASEDAEEELKNTNINEGFIVDEMTPSETSEVELTVATLEDMGEELKDTNACESTLSDEMPPSDTLDVELTVATSVDDVNELKDTNKKDNTLMDKIPPSDTLDVDLMVAATEDVEEGVKGTNTLIDKLLPSDTLDVELTGDASVDDVEEFKNTNINESSLTDEILPSDTSDAKVTVAANEDVKEELIDEMSSSDLLLIEPTLIEVRQIQIHVNVEEKTMDISSAESVDVQDQTMEDELQEVSTINKENSISTVPFSNIEEAEPVLEEAEPVLDIKLKETKAQDSDDISLKANEESEDPSVSVKLEIMQGSQIEVMDVSHPYADDKFHIVETGNTNEGDMEDLLPPIMHIPDAKQTDAANEDTDIDEAILIDGLLPSDELGAEPTSKEVSQLESSQGMLEATMEVSTTKIMDVEDQAVENELPELSSDNWAENDIANTMPAEPTLAEEVSEPNSTPVELKPTMQLSDIEVQDAIGQNTDDAMSLAINAYAGDSYINNAEQSSHQLEFQPVEDVEVNHSILEQSLEYDSLETSILLMEGATDPLLEVEKNEDNISSIELVEASADTTLLLEAETGVIREDIYITGDFLSSGAALLEDPSKVEMMPFLWLEVNG